MDSPIRFRPFFFVLFFGIVGFLGAQDLPAQSYSFRWKSVDGAGAYLAEVQDPSGKIVVSQKVADDQTSLTVSLTPGPYSLRLTTLNRFLEAEASTDWVPIHIAAPSAPEIAVSNAVTPASRNFQLPSRFGSRGWPQTRPPRSRLPRAP